MKLIKKSATKNVLDNTKTIMDFADNILLPSQNDLQNWFLDLDIQYKAIFSIRFYIQEIFELRSNNKDEDNNSLHILIDDVKSYFYKEKYLENEQWWNIKDFQKSILKLTKYIDENDTYLQSYVEPSREMLYEIASQKQCDASYFNIKSLKPFRKLLLLQDLSLQESSLEDISDIEHLTYLTILNIKRNNIKSIKPLSYMRQLRWLGASQNNISDLSSLSSLVLLEQLDLRWNKIEDISPLSNLSDLKILYCGVNQIQSIKPLSSLRELLILGCSKNQIQSLKPLRGLHKLIKILVSDNDISHIDSICDLQKVVSFDFRNNKVSSMESIFKWKEIKNIGFDGNNIPQDQIKDFIKVHDSCFVHNNDNVKEQQEI